MITIMEGMRGLVLLQGTREPPKPGSSTTRCALRMITQSHSDEEAGLAKMEARRPLPMPLVVKDKNNGEFKRE